jgi:4-hydroxyphenylacetate 3-monooxygenase
VYLRGKRVEDVTSHPAYRNSVATSALLYDMQNDPEHIEKLTFVSPDTGDRVNRCWELPTSYAALRDRRDALALWAEPHLGFMGRSPDHVASGLCGMVMADEVFEAYDPARAGALRDYYRFARDNDLFLSYVIVNPQADKSKEQGEQADAFLTVREVERDGSGIIVKGAKMLGTSCIMSNEVMVASIAPLAKGEDAYAISFCIPMNTPGLKVLSRKSYEEAAGSIFDNPLSSRFDENDAVIYFDEVAVPWERIFVAGDVAMAQRQWHATPAHVYQNYQCQIRLLVKVRFLVGLAHKIAETNAIDGFPQVKETLGQLAADATLVEAMVDSMEVQGHYVGPYFVPDRKILYAAQVHTQQMYPRLINTLRSLAGGGMIMLPSSVEDYGNPEIVEYIHRTQQSPVLGPDERVKLFKLAWDAVGSEFASRHEQYEMFYAGASYVTKGNAFRTYDWENAVGLVDDVLAGYSLDETLKGLG